MQQSAAVFELQVQGLGSFLHLGLLLFDNYVSPCHFALAPTPLFVSNSLRFRPSRAPKGGLTSRRIG